MKKKRNVLVTLGWYDPRFFAAIGRFAREANWHLAMRSMVEGSAPEDWKGDGMLINDSATRRLERSALVQARKQPTVLFGVNHNAIDAPSVQEDNDACGRLAAHHFLERGHRHFAWFGIQRGRVESQRRDGFAKALREAGQQCTLLEWEKQRGKARDTWSNCRRWLAERLRALPKPLALFVLDDLLAADTIEVCLDHGLRVPEDVAVMGAGNIELACECSRVPISSVDLNMYETAYRAAQMLEQLMSGRKLRQRTEIIPLNQVVPRASTDTVAVSSPSVLRALEFITGEMDRNIGVADLARAAGVSRRSLHDHFLRELRVSPARHLLLQRLDRAKQLLAQTDLKVGEIARQCGFATLRNIHRCFVRELGITPIGHRRHAHGQKRA